MANAVDLVNEWPFKTKALEIHISGVNYIIDAQERNEKKLSPLSHC